MQPAYNLGKSSQFYKTTYVHFFSYRTNKSIYPDEFRFSKEIRNFSICGAK